MAVTLNRRAFEHARELIDEGRFVFDERDEWSEHQPSARAENEYIRRHGFRNVHRCGLLTAESRAGQYKHFDIENAAAHLHGMLEGPQGLIVSPEAVASGFPGEGRRGRGIRCDEADVGF